MPSRCESVKTGYESLKNETEKFQRAYGVLLAGQGKIADVRERLLQVAKSTDALQESLLVTPESARELLGDDHFFGVEAIKQAFGFDVPESTLPKIPYSEKQMRLARERGESLFLRVAEDSEGNPMTLERMFILKKGTLVHPHTGRSVMMFHYCDDADWALLENYCPFFKDPFFTAQPLRFEWKLVGTTEKTEIEFKSFPEHTGALREYLLRLGYIDEKESAECSDEVMAAIAEKYRNTGKIGLRAKELAALSVNKNNRRSAAEIVYDTLLRFFVRGDFGLLGDQYEFSSTISKDEDTISVGGFATGTAMADYLNDDNDASHVLTWTH